MRTDDKAREAVVRDTTELASPPLVPELRLHLVKGVSELWDATEELDGENLPPPFWAFCWPGGQVCARYLLDHPEVVRGRTVLDFAAGSGLGAIACCRAGAARVIASEIDDFAITAMELNAAENGAEFEISFRDVVDGDDGWDVVLAGDVCYERAMADRIVRWLRRLAARGALVLLADPGRPFSPRERLEELVRYDVPTSREIEEHDVRPTMLYRVLP